MIAELYLCVCSYFFLLQDVGYNWNFYDFNKNLVENSLFSWKCEKNLEFALKMTKPMQSNADVGMFLRT